MHSYIEVIRDSVYLFPLIALLFTVPYMLWNYHKYGSVWSFRIVVVYSFILYLMTMFFLVCLPLPTYEQVEALRMPRMQLNLFAFVQDILKDSDFQAGAPSTWISLVRNQAFYQFAFNVLMTIPFGMYLRWYFRRSLPQCVLFGFGISLFFEVSQLTGLFGLYPRNYRLFDVDDLLANTLGAVCGWLMLSPLMGILPSRGKMDANSYRRGEKISWLRRACGTLADGIFLMTGYALLGQITVLARNSTARLLVLLAIYFLLIPLVWSGKTLGLAVVSARIASTAGYDRNGALPDDQSLPSAGLMALCMRYGLLFGFVLGVPALMFWLLDQNWLPFWLCGILVIALFGGYLIGMGQIAFGILRGKTGFYAKWSHTRIVSAIAAQNKR